MLDTSETTAADVQALSAEVQRLGSKVDQQSILLQELLRSREPANLTQEPADAIQEPADLVQQPADTIQEPADLIQEPADTIQEPGARIRIYSPDTIQEPAEASQKPAQEVGMFSSPYFDTKFWKARFAYGSSFPIQGMGVVTLSYEPLRSISIRNLPIKKWDGKARDGRDYVLVGIEICLADEVTSLSADDNHKLSVPFTIKKGSTMRLDSVTPNFGSYPLQWQLESDVVGSLGYGSRMQCFWRVPVFAFTWSEPRELLLLLDSSCAPQEYQKMEVYKGQWRISFNVMYALDTAA